jgi:hypothetical protein
VSKQSGHLWWHGGGGLRKTRFAFRMFYCCNPFLLMLFVCQSPEHYFCIEIVSSYTANGSCSNVVAIYYIPDIGKIILTTLNINLGCRVTSAEREIKINRHNCLSRSKIIILLDQTILTDDYPVHLLVIPMYICTSQSLFSHSYVVNE